MAIRPSLKIRDAGVIHPTESGLASLPPLLSLQHPVALYLGEREVEAHQGFAFGGTSQIPFRARAVLVVTAAEADLRVDDAIFGCVAQFMSPGAMLAAAFAHRNTREVLSVVVTPGITCQVRVTNAGSERNRAAAWILGEGADPESELGRGEINLADGPLADLPVLPRLDHPVLLPLGLLTVSPGEEAVLQVEAPTGFYPHGLILVTDQEAALRVLNPAEGIAAPRGAGYPARLFSPSEARYIYRGSLGTGQRIGARVRNEGDRDLVVSGHVLGEVAGQ